MIEEGVIQEPEPFRITSLQDAEVFSSLRYQCRTYCDVLQLAHGIIISCAVGLFALMYVLMALAGTRLGSKRRGPLAPPC